MKQRTFKEQDTDARLGRKRFLERMAQTRDAEKEIKEYTEEEFLENKQHQRRPD